METVFTSLKRTLGVNILCFAEKQTPAAQCRDTQQGRVPAPQLQDDKDVTNLKIHKAMHRIYGFTSLQVSRHSTAVAANCDSRFFFKY